MSFSNKIKIQESQIKIITKLYKKNGLELKLTSEACPEQYNIFKDDKQVAYYRLRHGKFRVDCPDCNAETIYKSEPLGDGIFDSDERFNFLSIAMRILLFKLN